MGVTHMTMPFDRLGGFATVRSIVMDFYKRALESDLIGPFFEGVDMARLVDHQSKFVASALGGPVRISDAELHAAHRHLGAGDAEFDEGKRLLGETLDATGIGPADRAMVLDAVERRRSLVVSEGGE
ncbi:MAG: group 1 truncated hemoglobin [Rhodobacteraceae bacterium]|nr:group 1 truncated hemoglobin [Paracoccaceae bacterium]